MAGHVNVTALYDYQKELGNSSLFPTATFSESFVGFNAPCRIEGHVGALEVTGQIPEAIDGTFYRVMPDPQFPPMIADPIFFDGDGTIAAFRIHKGRVDFDQRYVQTHRWLAENKAGRALFGKYRNKYTDDPTVEGVLRTVSNTNIIFHRGVLLATKEDGPPFAMNPDTLDTIGVWDFEGQVRTPTFTAHPKFDPKTGEMVCFGYEATGDASTDVVCFTIDAQGKKTSQVFVKSPYCGMIHDCAITDNYIILPMTPLKCSEERLKKGGNHWAWDPEEDQCYGLVKRRGAKQGEVTWFHADNGFQGHVAGAYEDEEGHVIMDLTVADGNVFYFFPEEEAAAGSVAARNKLTSPMTRWRFDPKAPSGTRVKPYTTFQSSGEFARIDDRFVTKHYTRFFLCVVDPSKPYDFSKAGPPVGGLFNCYGHFNWSTMKKETWFAGPTSTVQEPVFIPRSESAAEGDGYLLGLVNRLDELRNDLVVLDTAKFEDGPIAVVRLPFKLRPGLHGNFVPSIEAAKWKGAAINGHS